MTRQLVALLRELQEGPAAPASEALLALSDLDADGLRELRVTWPQIPEDRKRQLLSQLRRLADERIELTFEKVNRMALSDSDPQVRRQAIENLWECEDPSLVPAVSQAMAADPDPAVRVAAASAVGQFVYLGELERVPEAQRRLAEEGLLLASAEDAAPAVRLAALQALGFSSRSEVPPLIEAAYRSGDELQVHAALIAMGRSANAAWAPAVTAELESPSPRLRLEAARAAGELDLRATVPELLELLEDVNEGVRRAAIWSLGQLGGQQAEQALQALLRGKPAQEEATLLEDALENLAFVDGTRDFLMLGFDDDGDDEH